MKARGSPRSLCLGTTPARVDGVISCRSMRWHHGLDEVIENTPSTQRTVSPCDDLWRMRAAPVWKVRVTHETIISVWRDPSDCMSYLHTTRFTQSDLLSGC